MGWWGRGPASPRDRLIPMLCSPVNLWAARCHSFVLFILTILLHSSSRTAPKTPAHVRPRAVGTHAASQTPQGECLAPAPLLALCPGSGCKPSKTERPQSCDLSSPLCGMAQRKGQLLEGFWPDFCSSAQVCGTRQYIKQKRIFFSLN